MVIRFTSKNPFDILQCLPRQSIRHFHLLFPTFLVLQAVVNTLYTHHLVPQFVAIVFLCDVAPFSPRDFIHPDSLTGALTAFLGAPFATPTPSFGSFLSRCVLAILLYQLLHPSAASKRSPIATIGPIYIAWVPVGLLRTLIAFIFTRSVGWAYPTLFRHWALCETSEGFGTGVVIWIYLQILSRKVEATEAIGGNVLKTAIHFLLHLDENPPLRDGIFPLGLLTVTLAALEGKPWTYACALLSAGLLRLLAVFISLDNRDRLPSSSNPSSLTISSFFHETFLPALRLTAIPLLAIYIPYTLQGLLPFPPVITPLPPPPRASAEQRNLLEIVMLSYPRPGDLAVAEDIITTTIGSYKPLLHPRNTEGQVALSVFTHAPYHPAFDHVRDQETNKDIAFYADRDGHSLDDYDVGQYLHLAEAFKWVASDRRERSWKRPEWVMVVEDDFPFCADGTEILKRAMWLLELGRKQASETLGELEVGTRAAFIGTGGSGLIFHHTLLPMLEHILRTHALPFRPGKSPFPPFATRRPADVVMQDCLLGIDSLCARRLQPLRSLRLDSGAPVSVKEDLEKILRQSDSDVTMFIPSRLVMDHIGGLVSTTVGKKGNTDKWRCGWRHAFHGRRGVGVLVV
ncbi:hypothetical protein V5O48_008103 [Marasmius crinis-equi]|uniref:Mannosyltransferase n=1 Tax=Marasmius crinis-equi TaxID=585013 RepID=A0ABR3FFC0_9AGAR